MSTGETSTTPTRTADFSTSVDYDGGTATARLMGTADLEAKGQVEEFVRALHEGAQTRGVEEVVMDFRGLTFMSSSCFKVFVKWVHAIQDLLAPKRYRVVLVSSPEMRWQRRSLRALRSLTPDLVTIRY